MKRLLLAAVLISGCASPDPVRNFQDRCGAMHACPNRACWEIEADLCGKVAALYYIETKTDLTVEQIRSIAHRELESHWKGCR